MSHGTLANNMQPDCLDFYPVVIKSHAFYPLWLEEFYKFLSSLEDHVYYKGNDLEIGFMKYKYLEHEFPGN